MGLKNEEWEKQLPYIKIKQLTDPKVGAKKFFEGKEIHSGGNTVYNFGYRKKR